jgi:hypothetical protein
VFPPAVFFKGKSFLNLIDPVTAVRHRAQPKL